MKTENHSINDVLAKNATSFFIPPFQRAYAWGRPEIERYFNDIVRIIKSELNPKEHDKLEHFFGTVVIKEEKAGFANKSVVVDGQQRLTTTLIFLIALRDSEPNEMHKGHITQNFLTNNSSSYQDKIKLKQVTKDWEAYRSLVKNIEPKAGIISNAYTILKRLIQENNRLYDEVKFEHYIMAIQRMNVAVIFLDERPFKGEDPQIIFETLNSLGKPLSLSDLLRNFVLLNMKSDKQSDIYEKTWHPKIEEILHENTSKFFRDYLQFRTSSSLKVVSDNNTKELYQQFKDFVLKEFESHTDFIDDIVTYVKCYKWILDENNSDAISKDSKSNKEIKELIRNIFHDIKSEAFKPFVLGLLHFHQNSRDNLRLSDEILISTLQTIRTYLIRRRVIGLTQGENKNIVTLSPKIKDILQGQITMLDILSTMFYKLRLPNDSEITSVLSVANFYEGLKKYVKLILGKIEEHRTKVSVDFRDTKITIEHIMPRTLENNWKVKLGENYAEIHKTYLHNIGNIILTEFNSEIGNKPFEIKKKKLETSSLNYRFDVIKQEYWNEESIISHRSNMIGWFLETFPLPESLKENSNWSTKSAESNSFSPLDSEAGELAEGNKPVELHMDGNSLKVTSWQDIFIKFLKHLKSSKDFDFEFIMDNQLDLFKREDTIVKWSLLKDLIDSNIDLSTRFKTFDGKVWTQVKKLENDLLFIHINISASNCMTRISSVMEKFSMTEDSVKIVLK